MKCSLGISTFLEEISSFPISYWFPLFLSIVHLRRLSYLSLLFLELCIRMCISFPFSLAFACLLFSAIHKDSLDNHFDFSWGWFWSLSPVQCYKHPSIVLQALYLPGLISLIYLSLPLYNQGIWFRLYMNDLVVSPTFFKLSLNFTVRSSWFEP